MAIIPELSYDNHIILDDISTWPEELIEFLKSVKPSIVNYQKEQKRIDKLCGPDVIARIFEADNKYYAMWKSTCDIIDNMLTNTRIIGFHCTKLIDYEIQEILENGLIPLNQDMANRRINKAFNNGYLPEYFKNKLINKNETGADCRIGRVFLFQCLSTLYKETDKSRLFSSWGGEAIYWDNEDEITPLQSIGLPAIVVASMDINDVNKANSWHDYSYISNALILYYICRGNRDYIDTDTCLKNTTKVLRIITNNNDAFYKLVKRHKS